MSKKHTFTLSHFHTFTHSPIHLQQGMALILTLVVITILAVLVLEFNYFMRVEAEISGNYRDSLKAYYLANSGVNFAYLLLRDDEDLSCDYLEEDWALAKSPLAMEEGAVTFQIIDECGKINVNSLLGKKGKINEKKKAVLERLFEILEIDRGLVDVICDWIDKDDETRDFGVEDSYYSNLENPYPCKNSPLNTVDELFLLQDFNDEVFYGEEKERGSLDFYLTVYGDGKVNINTAPSIVLQSLHPDIDASLAREIVEYRKDTPFKKITDLKEIPGIDERLYNEISPHITIKSNFFSISSQGALGEARRRIKTILQREGKNLKIKYWRIG
ncbi:type II secretion system minor pseudopilin GspK [bacterium]|nr:type II secretion system minor pseudopilin GspK [bacterium]